MLFSWALLACPWLAEIYSDPNLLTDAVGEFLEIHVPESALGKDSLAVLLDTDTLGRIPMPEQAGRIVFCHGDSLYLIPRFPVACSPLLGGLPNSRPGILTVHAEGCLDSTWLPESESGLSYQRLSASYSSKDSLWNWTKPTPGFLNPLAEEVMHNATLRVLSKHAGPPWSIQLDTILLAQQVTLDWHILGSKIPFRTDTISGTGGKMELLSRAEDPPWLFLKIHLEEDSYPLDNEDSLLLYPEGRAPIQITEVHACPMDDSPEWIEVKNQSGFPLPLDGLSVCGIQNESGDPKSLEPGGIAIITDHTDLLRSKYPGIAGFTLLETKNALSLANGGDTVRICFLGHPVDTVFWTSTQSPECSAIRATPGYQSTNPLSLEQPRIQSRILSRTRKNPLQIRFPQTGQDWQIRVIAHDGSTVLSTTCKGGIWTANMPLWSGQGIYGIKAWTKDASWIASFVVMEDSK